MEEKKRASTSHDSAARLRITVIGPRGLDSVFGGVERHCALLYPALIERAPEMAIRLFIRSEFDRTSPARLSLETVRSPSGATFETLVYALRALLRSAWSSDIIHFHGIGPAFLAPFARACGAKVVMTHHALDYERPKWGWSARTFLKLGERLGGTFSHRVICVSEALRRDFLARMPRAAGRTVTIRHGAEIGAPTADDQPLLATLGLSPGRYLLAVGRLEETKRLADLIVAHRAAGEAAMPLVIVGASIGDTRHEQQLRALAEGQRVIFLGSRRGVELAALYRHAAAFFHASAMEGFGLVVLEALLADTPVLLSDIPVHREFDLPEACYFPLGDHIAIARLMRDVRPRTEAWDQAGAIATRYSLTEEVLAHIRIYRELGASVARRAASNAAQ